MAYSNWQPAAIPLVGGVDTKTDEKTVPVGKLVKLENGIFEEHGALSRRIGYSTITDSAVVTPEILSTFKDELLLSSDTELKSQRLDGWETKAKFEHSNLSGIEVCQQPEEQFDADQCETDVIRGFVWATSAGIFYSIQEKATGQWLVNNAALDDTAGTSPRCVAVNNQINFIWAVTAATNIEYAVVNNNDPTNIESSGVLISDMHADGLLATAQRDLFYYVAYKSTATNDIRCARISGNVVDLTVDTNEATVDSTLLNVTLDDDYLILVYTNSTGTEIRAAEFQEPRGSFTFIQNISIVSGLSEVFQLTPAIVPNQDSESEDVILFYNDDETISTAQFRTDLTEIETGVGILQTHLASQAFVYDDVAYVVGKHTPALGLQNAFYLLRAIQYSGGGSTVERLRVVGQFALGAAEDVGVGPTAINQHMPSVQNTVGSQFDMCMIVKKRLQLPTDTDQDTAQIVYSETNLKSYALTFTTGEYTPAEVGDALYIPGSMLWLYDGVNLGEAQPLMYPEPNITIGGTSHSFVSVLGAGGNIAAGTYGYRIAYERRTHYNETVRSFSQPFSVLVAGANSQVTLTIPTLVHTNYDDWYIVVYRTTDGGVTYHRVTDPNPTNNTGNGRWVDNDRTAATVIFTDDQADSTITDNDIFPLQGGVLANLPIPSPEFIAQSKRRVFAAGGENRPYRVYYSKLRGEGVTVEFNDQLFVDVEEQGGPITALATLNDALVVFKRNRVYLVNGDGPNNLGLGDFNPPINVPSDSGCTDNSNAVEMPFGVMYKSSKGIYLLGQNARVQYIGAPVERFNSLNTVSASLLPDQNAVLFLHSDGVALYYDYNFDQWSTFTGHTGLSATVWQNRYTYLAADGTVYFQDETNYRDGNRPYVFKARTAPIRMGGLQEYWRCGELHVLGEHFTPHKLQVDAYYNRDTYPRYTETKDPADFIDDATWGSQATWGADNVWGGDGRDYRMSFKLHPQKCEAISFEFTEVPDSMSNGQSFQLTELAILWAPLRGMGKLPASRKS